MVKEPLYSPSIYMPPLPLLRNCALTSNVASPNASVVTEFGTVLRVLRLKGVGPFVKLELANVMVRGVKGGYPVTV